MPASFASLADVAVEQEVLVAGVTIELPIQVRAIVQASQASVHGQLAFHDQYHQRAVTLSILENVWLDGTGAVSTMSGDLVPESVVTRGRAVFHHPVRSVPAWRRRSVLSLVNLPWSQSSIYHWLVEMLPRLVA